MVHIEVEVPTFVSPETPEWRHYTEFQRILGGLLLKPSQSLSVTILFSESCWLRVFIAGREAVSGKWIEHVLETVLGCGGLPLRVAYRDLENPEQLEVVLVDKNA